MTKLVRTEWHAETIIAIEKREREGERENSRNFFFAFNTTNNSNGMLTEKRR